MVRKVKNPERIKYKNYKACRDCPNKDKCTKSSKGRTVKLFDSVTYIHNTSSVSHIATHISYYIK